MISSGDCLYPQEWWSEGIQRSEDNQLIANPDYSRHRAIGLILDHAAGVGMTDDQIEARFGAAEPFSQDSCIQDSYVAVGDCSDGDQLAVFAQYGVRDIFRGATEVTSDYDVSYRLGNYCLVVLVRDDVDEYLSGGTYVPEPIRATLPQFRTLVGLENSVWYDVTHGENPTDRSFRLGIDTAGADYYLDVHIWLSGIQIDIDGDGNPESTRTCEDVALCPGTEDDPVYTFEYEIRAIHPFTIRTLWTGYAEDEVGTVLNIEPGLMWNEFTFDWETVEVRSSLDD